MSVSASPRRVTGDIAVAAAAVKTGSLLGGRVRQESGTFSFASGLEENGFPRVSNPKPRCDEQGFRVVMGCCNGRPPFTADMKGGPCRHRQIDNLPEYTREGSDDTVPVAAGYIRRYVVIRGRLLCYEERSQFQRTFWLFKWDMFLQHRFLWDVFSEKYIFSEMKTYQPKSRLIHDRLRNAPALYIKSELF